MQPTQVRLPAVAGRFYPSTPAELMRDVDGYMEPSVVVEGALGCIAPHAGYMYSGRVAGAVYSRLPARSCFLILGPNHFGRGSEPLALTPDAHWRSPLGDVPINSGLAAMIRSHCPALAEDAAAHEREHSIEVQLPFLQRRAAGFSFAPISVGAVGYETLVELGQGIARALREFPDPVMIVASSDMNHYEPDALTRIKDGEAIERILALDTKGLYEVVRRRDISMCGIGPAIAMLTAVKEMGASSAILAKYATSADAGGDASAVVGYAGIVIQ
ncbi:MAG TPA: AmmeMemoRadiSam system protein B [Terriglobia bacterium]|nr:AmmeMemoRadiSam system protein B [Terriglobia bacterium]